MNPNNNNNLPVAVGSPSRAVQNLKQTFKPQPKDKASARQLCLLVLDASGSMKGAHYGGRSKADEVNEATQNFIMRLKQSRKRADFHVGVLNFDSRVVLRHPVVPVTEYDTTFVAVQFNDLGRATDVGKALEEAFSMCEAHLQNYQPGGLVHSAVIILMSDGMCHKPEITQEIAERIKQVYPLGELKIATSLFCGINEEDDEMTSAQELLQTIASTGPDGMPCYLKTNNTEALRNYFYASSLRYD